MKRIGKGIWIISMLALFVILSEGFTDRTEAKEKVVIVGNNSSLSNLDPAASAVSNTIELARNLFMGLMRYKFESQEIEGDLAEQWNISRDGLVYTFRLKDNIKFHKGFGKVTAHDVKFSIDRVKDPQTKSPYMGELAIIKEVKVIDDLTLEIYLKDRDASLLKILTRPKPVSVVSKKAVEQYGKDFGRNPIGSGPFEFQSISREEVVVTAFKDYHEGPADIDKLVFKVIPDQDTMNMALMKGDIDLSWALSRDKTINDRMEASGVKIKNMERGGLTQLLMNPEVKPLDNPLVRKAIAHAMDKDAIVTHVLSGYGRIMDTHVPRGYFGFTTGGLPRYEHNPQKAKELLAQAGFPNGFEITMISNNLSSSLPPSMAFQSQMAKVGIKINLDVGDNPSTLAKLTSGKAAMFIYTGGSRPDTSVLLEVYHHSSGFPPGLNLARYNKLDRQIGEVRRESDPNKQLKLYHELQKRLLEDLPTIPMMNLTYPVGCRSHLTGIPGFDMHYGIDYFLIRFVK